MILSRDFANILIGGFLLTKAIKKYGMGNFHINLIEDVNAIEKAYELEQYYIKKYNSKVPHGYNLTDGGDMVFGWERTKEYRQKCSIRSKQLHKERRTGMYGKLHSDETKKRMSEAVRGKPKPWLIGRSMLDETKEKIRAKHLGKKLSYETRKRISRNHHNVSGKNNPMYGKKHSPETITKLSQKAKLRPKRIWVNNGIIENLIVVGE